MPYPSEHACRLHEPGLYEEDSFRRIKRGDLVLIIGKKKGQDTTEAQAYRYPVGDWEEAEARAHCKKAGGKFEPATEEDKAMSGVLDLREFERVIVGDQVVDATWVADVIKAESEREKLRQAREARAKRYGIGVKEGGALTPPAGYPTSEADYGDPVNYRYPCDAGHARGALGYFNQDGQREDGGYSAEEWAIVGERLAKAISKHLEADYQYEAGKIRRKEEKAAGLNQTGNVAGDENTLIAFGDEVKAVGEAAEGKVGGYLVRFSTAGERDLTGTDYFAADTYYGPHDGDGADTMVHHGMALKAGLEGLATRILAPIKTRRDTVGIWAETVLNLADEYEKVIYEMVEAGKLKWSSGTAARLARREQDGKISRWPIIEGSLTPTPMEPRLPAVMPLKAYLDALAGTAEPGGASAGALGLEVVKARARVEMLLADVENADS